MFAVATLLGPIIGIAARLTVPRARLDAWTASYPHLPEMLGAALGTLCVLVIAAIVFFVPPVRRYIRGTPAA
jgi:hypothetical protein